ncbi:MAG: hypothetical protein II520_03400, partial [Bacilli bacterium]|nr:hypothetical protein [Bacilli bacterium]
MEIKDRSSVIFGNVLPKSAVKKAAKSKAKFIKKFGDDSQTEYHLKAVPIPSLSFIGAKNLVVSDEPLK